MVIGSPSSPSKKSPPKLVTEPSDVVVVEGPFEKSPQTNKFKISNPSPDARIGFKIKTTSPERVAVTPKCGILAPGEHVDAAITVESFSNEKSNENRRTEKLLLLSAFSEVNRLGKDFDSPVELWGRVKPGNIERRTITLQLTHQDKTEEPAVICGDQGFTGHVGPIPVESEKNIGPIPVEPEKNRLNSGSDIDPERLPKAIKLVEDLIADKRKMEHDAMVHEEDVPSGKEEDVPSGKEAAEEKEPEGVSALKAWQWIGITALGCAAGVIGSIVAYLYFRKE